MGRMKDVQPARRWVWLWTAPAALLGWLVVGALVPTTIPGCGWAVINSGIVREQVWLNFRGLLLCTTTVALGLVIIYSVWARNQRLPRIADALFCLGIGATAWALPWIGLGYTLGDHWDGGGEVRPLSDGLCGLEWNWFAAILVLGGFFGIGCWFVLAVRSAVRRSATRTSSG